MVTTYTFFTTVDLQQFFFPKTDMGKTLSVYTCGVWQCQKCFVGDWSLQQCLSRLSSEFKRCFDKSIGRLVFSWASIFLLILVNTLLETIQIPVRFSLGFKLLFKSWPSLAAYNFIPYKAIRRNNWLTLSNRRHTFRSP